MNFNQTN